MVTGSKDKTRRCPKCKKASFKELGNSPGFEKSTANRNGSFLEFKMGNIGGNKTPQSKITNKTSIETMMLMRNFFSGIVFMGTFFFGKLFCQMFVTVHVLKQY